MANTPAFASNIKRGFAQVATAPAAGSAIDQPSSNQITLFTAGTSGSKVFEIVCQGAQAAIAAGVVRIFVGASTTTGRLYDEFLCTAITGSTTATMWRSVHTYDNFLVAASEVLVCVTSITQTINVHAAYGDF